MSSSNWFTRFPPSDKALLACREVVERWKEEMGVKLNLDETTWKLAARVNSWLGPRSVEAGVMDLMGGKPFGELPEGAMTLLIERMTRRLLADELLGRPVLARAQQRPEQEEEQEEDEAGQVAG